MLPFIVTVCLALVRPGDIESSRPGIDVERYVFSIAVTDSSNVISGVADVTVRFTKPVESFFLDLVGPQADGSGMKVQSVRQDGTALPFQHDGNRLNIPTAGAEVGGERTFRISYSGRPADGLIISANRFGSRTFFADNWPNRARYWLPTVDHPADKAMVEWTVSAPGHYQVVANGEFVSEALAGGGDGAIRITRWKTKVPISTKVMVVGVADFSIDTLGVFGGVPLSTWVYPENEAAGFTDFAVATAILPYFVSEIGPFPYAKLANVQSTTRYGGMENAGAIFYAEQGVTGRRANEGTVAHEIAHQWFGDSVTERDWHHIWLSEGFATYFADLYYEHEYGNDEFRDRLIGERQQVVSYAQSHPYSPVVDTRIKDPNHLLSVNSYQKGGWVLHMLRNEIGTDAFWKGIRLYYQRFRDGNALTDDLRQAMEEVSGKDLEGFFDQWIFKPGLPVVGGSWSVAIETGKLALIIRQEQSEPFDFPLEIGVTTMSGEHLIKTVRVTETLHQFDLDIGQAVRSVEIDPNTNLLFINEFGG